MKTIQSPASKENFWIIAWLSLRRNLTGMIGLVGFGLLVLVVLLAPILAPVGPIDQDYDHLLEPPSKAYIFGTDDLGRDVFSRVLYGGRESLRVALLAISIAAGGGIIFGLLSGYFGNWIDTIIMRVVDVLLAFPSILFLLSIVAALGPNLSTVLIALGIAAIPSMTRLVRGSVLATKNKEYITSARIVGATDIRIMFVHILPNILATMIIYSTLGLGSAIMITAGLSYIGLGAQPPSPEWGAMLNYGRSHIRTAWWLSAFPGLAIFLSMLFINLLGDGLRDALDPKLRI
ncbi:MAG: ABC transporter permease [Anaerolineales bacterium]|nr:ABC transporter permease [Anaerolineales bacterium]